MRLSRSHLCTLRETPSGADSESHKLLLKAGLVVAHAAGIYSYTPILWRAIKKLMAIVSEEMDRAGAQEMLMPVLSPEELWERSGRLQVYGESGLLFRLRDRRDARFVLGPTHEEVVTDLVGRTVSSYRQLPLTLYHQGVKFRDEGRPQYGLIRSREFVMKDAYSFDSGRAGLDASYAAMRAAYERILARCELDHVYVEADVGEIGGASSEEVLVLAPGGTEVLLRCTGDGCAHVAPEALARSACEAPAPAEPLPMAEVATPGVTTIEQLAGFLPGVPVARMVKSLIFRAGGDAVMVLIRADCEASEEKVKRAVVVGPVALAGPDDVRDLTGAEVGFAGPVGLAAGSPIRVLADETVRGLGSYVCGANRTDHHLVNVNLGRDAPEAEYLDLRLARAGEPCALCGAALERLTAFEAGHLFMLGTRYSSAMGATFLDSSGQQRPFEMGCYGLGITRLVALAVEQQHDDRGIVWPKALAPYQVHLVLLSPDRPSAVEAAETIYANLLEAGVDVLYDDRADVRAGVKFADADLLGMPWRINVGRAVDQGLVELVERATGLVTEVPVEDAVAVTAKLASRESGRHGGPPRLARPE